LRLLHKAATGLVVKAFGGRGRLREGLSVAGCWASVLGESGGPGRAPEFDEVVGGGAQFPLGLAGS
jgi:hypothetical protein